MSVPGRLVVSVSASAATSKTPNNKFSPQCWGQALLPGVHLARDGNKGFHLHSTTSKLSLGRLFLVWLTLGAQSFGGGVATFALIRNAAVDRFEWVTEEEFLKDNALSRITPGMNILALTILLGKRAAGVPGVFVSLAGLILPSACITILITAFYSQIQGVPIIASALKGVVPATIGLGLFTAFDMAAGTLKTSRAEGRDQLWAALGILLLSGLSAAFLKPPVILILLVAGFASGLFQWRHAVKRKGEAQK